MTVDGARKTVFGHDAAGNRTSVSSPNFGTVTFAHTALGELRTRTDAKSQQTTHTYDRLGRLLTATDADGESRWVYDGANGKGLLARRCRSATANANCAKVGEYRETLAWNADARPSKRTTEVADGATTHTYAHVYGYRGDGDPDVHDGRLATIAYPYGLTVRREYNARGYLSRLVDAASNTALETYGARDAYGNVLTETYGTDQLGNHTALAVAADPQVTGMAYGARTNTAAPGPDAVTAATAGGVDTKLSYDAAGHVTRYDRKTGDDRFVVWDARGLPASVTEGAGAATRIPAAREAFH